MAPGTHAPYSESVRSRASSALSLRSAKSPGTAHGETASAAGRGEGSWADGGVGEDVDTPHGPPTGETAVPAL